MVERRKKKEGRCACSPISRRREEGGGRVSKFPSASKKQMVMSPLYIERRGEHFRIVGKRKKGSKERDPDPAKRTVKGKGRKGLSRYTITI